MVYLSITAFVVKIVVVPSAEILSDVPTSQILDESVIVGSEN
jgi:hypothetical protein